MIDASLVVQVPGEERSPTFQLSFLTLPAIGERVTVHPSLEESWTVLVTEVRHSPISRRKTEGDLWPDSPTVFLVGVRLD